MNYFFKNIALIVCSIALMLMAGSCTDDNNKEISSSFGYFQLRVQKQIQTYGLTSGSSLDYLNDAKKIQVDLLYNNRQVSQTLNLTAVNSEAAELGLTSESIQLLAGEYTLTGYKIYGEYVEGVTPGDKAPVLQEGEPDEPMYFSINNSEITKVTLDVVALRRGKVSFILDKDFSAIQPEMKAAGYDPENFKYNNIKKVELDVRTGLNGAISKYVMKTHRKSNEYLMHTDTISLRVNDYTTVQMRMYDAKNNIIMVVDEPQSFSVEDEVKKKVTLTIDIPMTEAFRDYIALYNIWKALDGENWYWRGLEFNPGSNFLFYYSDGTPRPLDLWGSQPGVTLDEKGRVSSLNLGSFNPVGFVPDAIGDLTALKSLYLGNHSEEVSIDPNIGPATLNKYQLMLDGVDLRAERMNIARERSRILYPSDPSSLSTYSKEAAPFKYVTYNRPADSNMSNRLTGISPAIGNCKELTLLSVANGLITEFPSTIAELKELTDIEIYNCAFTQLPDAVAELENLVALNFSKIKGLDLKANNESFRKLFDGPSKNTLQIIYMTENKLEELPDNMSNLKKLGLIDITTNKVKKMPMLGSDISLVQCLIEQNEIESIPDNWFNPDDLEKLAASNNKITVFPNMFKVDSPYKPEEVDFSGNLISSFPANFTGIKVEVLNLNSNRLTEFPVEFSETGSDIDYLRLSINEMDTIRPEAIKNLRNLTALECNTNRLRYMPREFNVENFPYLTGMDISFNNFEVFPYAILNINSLSELRIQSQLSRTTSKACLTEWPDNIDKHPALRVLDISQNDIRFVRNFPLLLNSLNISGNPNISITVPELILYRILTGTFQFIFDENQDVSGI